MVELPASQFSSRRRRRRRRSLASELEVNLQGGTSFLFLCVLLVDVVVELVVQNVP